MIFACCERQRLEVLRRSGSRNAIDFLEVLDHAAPAGVPPQRTLFVRLLHPATTLTADNVSITGGERIPEVAVEWVAPANALPPEAEAGLVDDVDDLPRTLVIRTRESGDFSRYTLAIRRDSGSAEPPADFDPLLASIEFSFKVECPTDFDCAAATPCAPDETAAPRIDYLAKDYAGFRRLMLDRLSQLAPGWTERSAADLGVTLVELLAFAADNLSYRQDVVANEAYLHTARQRISVRRHARLVDYFLHEGCNARAFVHFEVASQEPPPPPQILVRGARLLTRVAGAHTLITPGSPVELAALDTNTQVFETAHDATLRLAHNQLLFHTWGDTGCCLPRGATRATLAGHVEALGAGDFLVFEEVRNPKSLAEHDADPAHRHVVRLTRVMKDEDPSGGLFAAQPFDGPVPITHIEWQSADALPFPLCISMRDDLERRPISVARGNLVLVDHGAKAPSQDLPRVPAVTTEYATPARTVADCCDPPPVTRPPLRFRPLLNATPVTHGFPLDKLLAQQPRWSAAALRQLGPRDALPLVSLLRKVEGADEDWLPRRDLLGSDADDRHFVVEVRDDGRAQLRFGDDTHGHCPDEGVQLQANYRTGNGAAGNVGAGAVAHLVTEDAPAIHAIRNPLPAFGGVDAEDVEEARRDAPQAFRRQQRAVTAADYAEVSSRHPQVQRAAATFRWTGSWRTVFVTADRISGAGVDPEFETALRGHLEPFRMAGYDLEVDAPHFVALEVALHVCVKPGHVRSEVLREVRDALSNRLLPDGRRGVFHPDNFTFGQPVYSSHLVAAAQSVPGVDAVRLERFERMADPDPSSLDSGQIAIGRLEVARLDDNPNYRERGRLRLTAGGGK